MSGEQVEALKAIAPAFLIFALIGFAAYAAVFGVREPFTRNHDVNEYREHSGRGTTARITSRTGGDR